ncbi:MAG: 50S ribosomal protein L35 [Bacteroidetes bacterium]|nr:50S ribosomal protein L35 [Rhodothermia bacterium]MCS7154647.1 50S ribosomal protein L35 [Bacteroidota bacterium]MCX7906364.1 50S ribosomal protein L35 [Bacteroidota bacterium]MDW8137440.1 50S ribosomal protein L35 [Bacteroidota bacterium]MDW8285606.1 50S ribosomal protein L35 [Bacteroidota bacterium]
MPKMKTHSSAKKRFRLTATGKIRRYRAGHSHLLTKKRPKRKRHLRQADLVAAVDVRRVKRLLAA